MKKLFGFFLGFVWLISPLTAGSEATIQNSRLVVYDDSLAENWLNWSWNSEVDFSSNDMVYNGSHSLRVRYNTGWAGLSLYKGYIPLFGMTALSFMVYAEGSSDQPLRVFANFDNGQEGPEVRLTVRSGQWQEVVIPLNQLNPEQRKIIRLNWQNASSQGNRTVYFDEISFIQTLSADAPQVLSAEYRAHSIAAGGSLLVVHAGVEDPQGRASIREVSLMSDVAGWIPLSLYDDGLSNDGQANDGIYGVATTLPAGLAGREVDLYIQAEDFSGNVVTHYAGTLAVLNPLASSIPAALPQKLGWGSNAWSEDPAQDWQKNTGLPWNYVYQYITWGWEGWGSQFVSRFVNHAWDNGYVPVVTVYLMLGATGGFESASNYASELQKPSVVQAYLQSFEKAVDEAAGDKPVIFVIEPDFYGFMQQLSNSANPPADVRPDDPNSFVVALNKNGYANTLSGFGQYLIDHIHRRAPNVLAAPMVSMWGVNRDPLTTSEGEMLDYAVRTAGFMQKMGADRADLITVEWSDRDAGRGIRPWWDDRDADLPRPNRAILWAHHLGRLLNKRLLLWQVPVGNMDLNNTCDDPEVGGRYQDNRAAYLFRYPRDMWEAGFIGILFGGGDGCSTQVWTDGGHVESNAHAYYQPPAVPQGLSVVGVEGALVYLRWQENLETDVTGYRLYYQQESGGAVGYITAGLRNAVRVILPNQGLWRMWLTAYDLNGGESSSSAEVLAETVEDAQRVYLPLVRR
ncbi:MAG: choice-of-anchor X domain-containing protein [Chloroflexota bacterium]